MQIPGLHEHGGGGWMDKVQSITSFGHGVPVFGPEFDIQLGELYMCKYIKSHICARVCVWLSYRKLLLCAARASRSTVTQRVSVLLPSRNHYGTTYCIVHTVTSTVTVLIRTVGAHVSPSCSFLTVSTGASTVLYDSRLCFHACLVIRRFHPRVVYHVVHGPSRRLAIQAQRYSESIHSQKVFISVLSLCALSVCPFVCLSVNQNAITSLATKTKVLLLFFFANTTTKQTTRILFCISDRTGEKVGAVGASGSRRVVGRCCRVYRNTYISYTYPRRSNAERPRSGCRATATAHGCRLSVTEVIIMS